MRGDPPVRSDGSCARKGCTKSRTIPKQHYATREQYESEPFCSRICCEKHYGIWVPVRNPGNSKRKREEVEV